MNRLHTGILAATVALLTTAFAGAARAQTFDHLACYPVRAKGNTWTVRTGDAGESITLVPSLAPFDVEDGCRLLQPRTLRPREVCLPADTDPRQDPSGSELSQVYACYAMRCRTGVGFDLGFSTQFGSGTRRVQREGGVRTLCVPTDVTITPSATPTAAPTPSASPSRTPTPSASPSPTASATPTFTAAPTPSATTTATPTPSASAATPTPSATVTAAPTPSTAATATATPVQTPTPGGATPTPGGTTPTPGTTPGGATATPGATPTGVPTVTPAGTPVPTPTNEPCGTSSQCVFVSSATYTGAAVGGIAGANAKCQQLAQAARLPGFYNAWIATEGASPSTTFPQSSLPYRRVDGVDVASSWSDLTDGTLDAPIAVTEKGTELTAADGVDVWTATSAQGAYTYPGCSDFTSNSFIGYVGRSLATNASWTASGSTSNCLLDNRLYCIQTSIVAPTPTPSPTPKPTPTPTATPNADPPVRCVANEPQSGMVYCYPTRNDAIDLHADLLPAAANAGVAGIDENTRLQVIAVGGNGGNGHQQPGCRSGDGGDGGYAATVTRVKDIVRFKGGTRLQWLAGDSGRHEDQGGTGGASSMIWVASSDTIAPDHDNTLVIAGGGGGGGACSLFDTAHDGGHGGYVDGMGMADNGRYDDYIWTTTFSMVVGPGEDGHGAGGHPGSQTVPGAGGPDYGGSSGGERDAGDGYGGRGGRVNDTGVGEKGGFTEWRAGSVDGPSVIGTAGRGSDNYFGTRGGAGGGGFGGGGAGNDGQYIGGGGGGGGSLALANTVFDTPAVAKSAVSNQVAFVFVK